MSLYKRGDTWYIYLTYGGRKIRQTTGTEDRKKAQEIHDQFKISLKHKKESGKTVDDAIALWLDIKPRNEREISAIRIFRELYQDRPLSAVTGHDIMDALAEKSPSNYNRIITNIQSAFNLAVKRKWCDPIHIPKKKVKDKRLRFLTKAEWEKLQQELPAHILPMARFSIATGLRQANVFNLKWSEIDLPRGVAWVDSSDAKGKKAIPIPLSDYAISVLKPLSDNGNEYVFTYKEKKVCSVKTAWNKALVRAKIKDFRWHDLRHTWASWHVMNGTPLSVLKELGGWSDISMVMRYAHLSPEHLKQYASNGV